jgi:tetratricopeptide (TPR) repeat protein
LSEAQKDAAEAIKLDPKFGPAYEGIAEVMFRTGKYAECIKYCNQSINFDPIGADAYYYRGCAYERLGNKDQATRDKNTAVKMGYDGKIPIRSYP